MKFQNINEELKRFKLYILEDLYNTILITIIILITQ